MKKFIKTHGALILSVLLGLLIVYLPINDYLTIDYESGITYNDLYLIYANIGFSVLVLGYLITFHIIRKRHQSSLLHLFYFVLLFIYFVGGWMRMNNKQILAFLLILFSVLLIVENTQYIREWWYRSKTQNLLTKILYLLSHNVILNITNLHVILFGFIKIKITRRRREYFYGYMFISLWLIGLIGLTLYPLFYSLYLSFTTSYYNLETGITSTWVGFQNYLQIFRNQTIMPLLGSYIGEMVLAVPLIIIFSILIAMLINQPVRGKGIWRTIFFLPVIISSGPILNELASQNATSLPSLTESDAISFFVQNLGRWMRDPIEALMTSLLLVLWYAGVPILIFLAGLQKIDGAVYEAASIDGASPWDRFWKITLPSIKPLISVAIIYVVVTMSLFVKPGGIIELSQTHMQQGNPTSPWWNGYGYAAALSWVYFFVMVVIMGLFVGLMSIRRRQVRR